MNKLRKKSMADQGTLTAFAGCTCACTCPCTCYCFTGYPTQTDYASTHDTVGFRNSRDIGATNA